MSSPEQITDIAGAANLKLEAAELEEMNRIGREVTDQFPENSVNMWRWS